MVGAAVVEGAASAGSVISARSEAEVDAGVPLEMGTVVIGLDNSTLGWPAHDATSTAVLHSRMASRDARSMLATPPG